MRQPRVSIAAVLFTDLVESTALRTRLGEDAADALQHRHDRLLADAIARRRAIQLMVLSSCRPLPL